MINTLPNASIRELSTWTLEDMQDALVDSPIEVLNDIRAVASELASRRVAEDPERPGSNEPLTLEELWEMDGQPAWAEFLSDMRGKQRKGWVLIHIDSSKSLETEPFGCIYLLNTWNGVLNYSEVWERISGIYRHPPKTSSNPAQRQSVCLGSVPGKRKQNIQQQRQRA